MNTSLRSLVESQGGALRLLPARKARFESDVPALHPRLLEWLASAGMTQFYSHQVDAWRVAASQTDVLIVTGTSSGKSLCCNVPVLQDSLTEPMARALYLFPTKALAQDQLLKISGLVQDDSILCATYDADTPKSKRPAIRNSVNIVLTNPDMLHVGILPQHELWAKFFRSLRTIVIDEAHIYRGVFGGHTGWILRRLLRLCHWYGSHPRIIGCSATIGNPEEVLPTLTGRPATIIDNDGSPSGEKVVLVVPAGQSGESASGPNKVTAALLVEAIKSQQRVLAFCRSRLGVELVLTYARQALQSASLSPSLVDSYRGGYSAKERRAIEKSLFDGKLMGLVSTNALELGVDVGGLDVVILNGYPGRNSSFWQQVGRAGRAGREGTAILLAHADPLEQYLATNPDLILDTTNEKSNISVSNRFIASGQIQCAAYERPISDEEASAWESDGLVKLDELSEQGVIEHSRDRYYYPSHDSPAPKINIRGASEGVFRLVHDGEVIGEMESWRATQYAHPGAIYLHRGETYQCVSLDFDNWTVEVNQIEADHFTQPIVQSLVESRYEIEKANLGRAQLSLVSVLVTTSVTGFRKMSPDGKTVLAEQPLTLPAQTLETIGCRLSFDETLVQPENADHLRAVHSLEHLLSALAPMRANCDRTDVGSAWYAVDPADNNASVYLFDMAPGGIGLSEAAFNVMEDLLNDCAALISQCPCETGCPLCLMSSRCESNNELIGKEQVANLIKAISPGPDEH